MENVPNPTLVIGDLHGSYHALGGNLMGADALDADRNWRHPGSDLIFLGDAICDRGTDDFKVTQFINKLRRQVEAAGGTCVTIAGNHDNMGLCFLAANPKDYDFLPQESQFAGASALASCVRYFHQSQKPEEIRNERIQHLAQGGSDDFLGRFKMSKRGREVICYLLNLDLYAVRGSTLFLHTPPTASMLGHILNGPSDLNLIFRKIIAHDLKDTAASLPSSEDEAQFTLCQVFLYSGNRKYFVPGPTNSIWQQVRDAGIEGIVFGHDFASRGLWKSHSEVQLLGMDFRYGRPQGTKVCSAVWLYPDGKVKPCSWSGATSRT